MLEKLYEKLMRKHLRIRRRLLRSAIESRLFSHSSTTPDSSRNSTSGKTIEDLELEQTELVDRLTRTNTLMYLYLKETDQLTAFSQWTEEDL